MLEHPHEVVEVYLRFCDLRVVCVLVVCVSKTLHGLSDTSRSSLDLDDPAGGGPGGVIQKAVVMV